MAYYKVLIEVWCDWDPENSDVEEIGRHVATGEDAICTLQEVVKVVDRPQDIDNEEAMSFFGGSGRYCPEPRVGFLRELDYGENRPNELLRKASKLSHFWVPHRLSDCLVFGVLLLSFLNFPPST